MKLEKGYWWADEMNERQMDFHIENMRSLERFLPWCKYHRGVVQAGGSYGLWAKYLADKFDAVWTFEPERISFECLVRNVEGLTNVIPLPMALHEKHTMVEIARKKDSCHQIVGFREGYVPAIALESFELVCDALILDVEGVEPQVLKGAGRIVALHHPSIMIEIRPEMLRFYGNKVEQLRAIMDGWNYKLVDGMGQDFIFVHQSRIGNSKVRPWPEFKK